MPNGRVKKCGIHPHCVTLNGKDGNGKSVKMDIYFPVLSGSGKSKALLFANAIESAIAYGSGYRGTRVGWDPAWLCPYFSSDAVLSAVNTVDPVLILASTLVTSTSQTQKAFANEMIKYIAEFGSKKSQGGNQRQMDYFSEEENVENVITWAENAVTK